MDDDIRILAAEGDAGDGVIVTFSDGTISGSVVEELLALRPYREPLPQQRKNRALPERGESATA